MPKRIRTEPIYIAPNIIGNIQEDGSYYVFDEQENINLNPENVFDKIKIYERQVKGWFLEPTLNLVKYKPKNKGFLVVMTCLSYIEAIEQYKTGTSSINNSQGFFINGINKLYPNHFQENQIRRLYNQARCGLFHDGMVKGQIIINNDFETSISFQENDIKINPKRFLNDVINDFNNYIETLHNDFEAREKFDKMFSNIN